MTGRTRPRSAGLNYQTNIGEGLNNSRTPSASATGSTCASGRGARRLVTYIACSSVGLDVGGESIPYVAGWGEDGALDAIREYAQTIDEIARRIEEASGRPVSIVRKTDPSLIGGLVLQADSLRVDASVRGRLNQLREDLVTRS